MFAFVVADGESSNGGESLQMTTNGGAWQLLDATPPISGNTFPTLAGIGTATATISGVGGTVGAHIIGRNSPTIVTVQTQAGGVQGGMFAVGVLWGFRSKEELVENGAQELVAVPREMLRLFRDGRRPD